MLKPGKDPTSPKNYRPISLLSNIGKLLETYLLDIINDHLEKNSILKDFQFGFRKNLSTSHALVTLSNKIATGLNNRSATLAVSLDFEKAFDTVWHEGLIEKMRDTFKFNISLVRIVQNYLLNRSFSVCIQGESSTTKPIKAGVPQGSVLGPALYNIYLADIPLPANESLVITYADDILIAATHPRAKIANKKINNYLEELNMYFDKWKLRLNIDKCKAITFKGKKGRLYKNGRKFIPSVIINGQRIENVKELKYLGVILDEKLNFIAHIDYILRKAKKSFHRISRALYRKNGLSTNVKMCLYKQLIRPVIGYAFPIWFAVSSRQMEKIRIFERKMLGYCLNMKTRRLPDGSFTSPSCIDLYNTAKLIRIDKFMTKLAIKTVEGCVSHENHLLRNSTVSDEQFQRLLSNDGHLSPMCLINLNNNNMLFDNNDNILFYNRPYGTYNIEDTIYTTDQY